MSQRVMGAVWAHNGMFFGGNEVVASGIVSLAERKHGRLQLTVKGVGGNSDYELGIYIEEELPNDEALLRVQRR